jgi:hypothetical protein
MSAKIKGISIAFEQPVPSEYAEEVCKLLMTMRHVAAATPSEMTTVDYFVREAVRLELEKKLWTALKDKS